MSAVRDERGLGALLLVLAGLAWWSSLDRMQGMDAVPWTRLGTLGWFLGLWVVMMAAMMLPSAIPAVALYGGLARDLTPLPALLFATGYLAVWAAAGLVAFGLAAVAVWSRPPTSSRRSRTRASPGADPRSPCSWAPGVPASSAASGSGSRAESGASDAAGP